MDYSLNTLSRSIRHASMLAAATIVISAFGVTSAQAQRAGSGYWKTSGAQIVDSNGDPVRIAGINWYGFETVDFIAHGLWAKDYKLVLNTIKAQGYNVIRLPFSNEMVERNPVPTNFTTSGANTDLVGLTSLQIMDKIVAYAGSIGLRVILDNHRSEAGNTNEANGLWYTSAYPQANWLADWRTMATRYSAAKFTFNGNPTVIGMDLRNEPHLNAPGGATGSCWTGDTATNGNYRGCPESLTSQNWTVAAKAGGNAVLAINPNLLIFVEGNDCYNGQCAWEGENLIGVANHPVSLSVANRVVYSAHDYGPDLYRQPWFNGSTTQSSLEGVWNKYWGYIAASGTAPVWLGEFGTGNAVSDATGSAAGSQGQWFKGLVTYLKNNSKLSWSYWALNGEDSYGLLDSNYGATPASAIKQSLLASIQLPVSSGPLPGFTLSAAASNLTLKQRASVSDQISVAETGGFGGNVTLSATLLPSGVTASFSSNPTKTSSVLTLKASSTAVTGTSEVTINGKAGVLTSSTSILLVVSSGGGGSGGGGSTGAKCAVDYKVLPYNNSAFGGRLVIRNTGTTSFDNWTLNWTFANGQTLTSLWNGTVSQGGAKVSVKNVGYNGSIKPGMAYGEGDSGVGFNGTWNGKTNAPITSVSLNGTTCAVN